MRQLAVARVIDRASNSVIDKLIRRVATPCYWQTFEPWRATFKCLLPVTLAFFLLEPEAGAGTALGSQEVPIHTEGELGKPFSIARHHLRDLSLCNSRL